ncbi:MAG: PQQ-binding-like beta-propeller repeat protein, partial [Planctomycetota bacterium]
MKLRSVRWRSIAVGAAICAAGASAIEAAVWPNWRGPQQNNVSTETGLIDRWNPNGGPQSNLLWKRDDLGTRSTPIVLNGKLYVLSRDKSGTPNEGEKVVCLDAATGQSLWEHRFNVYLSDVLDTHVAWSSCVADPETGRVYALGVCGYFCCLEGESGDVVWSRTLHQEFGLITTHGGRTNVPVVFEDLVLISGVIVGWGDQPEFGNLAESAHRFLAFDKGTGAVRWLNGTGTSPHDSTYSTPTVAVIAGEQQLIFGAGDGEIWSMQPRTGVPLWHYPFSRRGLNVSPLVVGDRVYSSHSEENTAGNTRGSVVALDAKLRGDLSGKELWRKYEVMAGKSSPLLVDGKLWVIDDRANLHFIDPNNGTQLGPRKPLGTVMRSTPLYADGKVYACTNGCRWYVLKPAGNGVDVIHKLRLTGESNDGS